MTVEGLRIGQLKGVAFQLDGGQSQLELRALRAAANRAVTPEINRRLGELAAACDQEFALAPDGAVLWRGEAAGFARDKTVRLLGELGAGPARERAQQRLYAYVAAQTSARMAPLAGLRAALAGGELRGLPRGLVHRLLEAGGIIDRAGIEAEVSALSQAERRALRSLGVRIGAFSLFLPGLLEPDALSLAGALSDGAWKPPLDAVTRLPDPPPSPTALSARGLRGVGGRAVPVWALEDLDQRLRATRRPDGLMVFGDTDREALGWTEADSAAILRGLGFLPAKADGAPGWRRRRAHAAPKPAPANPASPFAALAALQTPPDRRKRRRRPRRKPAAKAAG